MTFDPSASLVPHSTITEMCSYRDASLARMRAAAEQFHVAAGLAAEALDLANSAHGMSAFVLRDYSKDTHYKALLHTLDPKASVEAYRKQLDARMWIHALDLTGMRDLMDRTAREQLDADLCASVPEFNEEAARQVLGDLLGDAKLIFQRGLARAFTDLDRRFKSHNGFTIGSRIIITHVFNEWGSFNYHGHTRETLGDVERAFAILDGKVPDPGALVKAMESSRTGRMERQQSYVETPYFRVRCFQNGNAHLWFRRDDLVDKANQLLADYYGEVLPDAPDDADIKARDIKSKSGLPARDLSFYPTPDKVIDRCLRDVHVTPRMRALDPSAGTGNMVRRLLKENAARVDAIEIDSGRAAALRVLARGDRRLSVYEGNFLTTPANPVYDLVLMNPPFYGTHWMDHVMHAYDFLAPDGRLVAVLPITAEMGESNKHEAFRKWAAARCSRYGSTQVVFQDLPPESFAESGTRINTVVLTLYKR